RDQSGPLRRGQRRGPPRPGHPSGPELLEPGSRTPSRSRNGFMNSFWHYLLGLLAVGLPTGLVAAQGPDNSRWSTLPAPAAVGPALEPGPETVRAQMDQLEGGATPFDRPGFIAGGGIYWMQPYFQNNLAYTVFLEKQVTPLPFDPNQPNKQTS